MAAGTALRVCICMPRQLAEFGDRVASSCGALSGAVQFTKCAEDSADLSSTLKQSEVVVAAPSVIQKHLDDLRNVKWVHSYYAGVNKLMKGSLPFVLTRHAGASYGQLMSEYVVAQMINWERQLYGFHGDQLNCLWNEKRLEETRSPRMLSNLSIGILGVGVIGRRVAEVCKNRLLDRLQEVLEASDYVCGILPSTSQTRGLLNGDVLKSCAKKQSVLINIGRGDLVSEETIVKAIEEGWLGGAILDVFETEPLPRESKLWGMPQVIITPHNSGPATVNEIADFFVENLKLFVQGKDLKHTVDCTRGY